MKALVLSGGGARGAYQAGVMLAVAEIAAKFQKHSPFMIYTGISAGAINASFLASGTDDFLRSTTKLVELWSSISSNQVFKTDALSIGKIGLSWVGGLSFGGATGGSESRSLLDTSPLYDLISKNIQFERIQQHIDNKQLLAVGLTALDYRSSQTVTFVEADESVSLWQRARRHSERVRLSAAHIVASSAIPILFAPARAGHRYFGDGCVRNTTPLSPALHLGADGLLVVGVRKWNPTEQFVEPEKADPPPSVAKVANVLLNSVLLDGVETDIERLKKINTFMSQIPEQHQKGLNFRTVKCCSIHPTEDIGAIAAKLSSRLPRVIRYLLKGLGPLEDASEIISYLLFEPDFCKRLIEIGYQDGLRMQDEINQFLAS